MNYLLRIAIVVGLVLLLWLEATTVLAATRSQPETFRATVTKYSSIDSCTTKACIMANGLSAQIGYAACPTRFRLGTKFLVNGQEYICGDRTAKRFDGRFDLFAGYGAKAHHRAIVWGIQRQTITIEP